MVFVLVNMIGDGVNKPIHITTKVFHISEQYKCVKNRLYYPSFIRVLASSPAGPMYSEIKLLLRGKWPSISSLKYRVFIWPTQSAHRVTRQIKYIRLHTATDITQVSNFL